MIRAIRDMGAGQEGFSLTEMLVSALLAVVVSGAVLGLLFANTGISRTTPEVVDLQQRARAAQELLTRDLYMAGAGVYLGPVAGPLPQYFAPVLPRRAGLTGADAFGVARADAITLIYVPQTSAQATLPTTWSAGSDVRVQAWPNCAGDPLCGLAAGTQVIVFDRVEHFDAFTVLQVFADSARLRSWQADYAPWTYPAGAVLAEVEWHTYYLDAQARQLRHTDGYLTDIPVVDDVVGLTFEYVGDADPPRIPKPSPGTENCLYDASGAYRGGLATLPADGGSLAVLPLDLFRDGPWCGDGENRFDADLLRIRNVRVTLRMQVGNDMMRGQSGDYVVPGRSRSAMRSLPDYSLVFDVAPRNLGGSAMMLMFALVATVVLSALGTGLVSLTTTEAAITDNYRLSSELAYAAEAAANAAISDLGRVESWTSVFGGAVRSSFCDRTMMPVLASGDRLDLDALTMRMQAASDGEARRGADNPRWRLYLYDPLASITRAALSASYVAVWVADDPSEADGDPATDSNGVLSLRAQAFGPRGMQRTIDATLAGDDGRVKLVSWRDVR